MNDTLALSAELAFYARHNCALFPIPAGSKAPFGIVASFAHDFSKDPEQWAAWQSEHPNCNFGLVAGPSRLIVVDVDVAEVGRAEAWRYWSEWCASHDLPVFPPSIQSARGGWHLLFSVPDTLDVATLRQCPLVGKIEGITKKAVIDLRVGNGFVVAAGSFYDGTAKGEQSGPYLLMSDAPPYPAPPALLSACARAKPKTDGISQAGTRDRGDVAALLCWMTEKDMFSDYDSWLASGLALKIEYGDDALPLWELTFDESVTADVIESKWDSFATDPQPGMTTINSLMQRAHAAGWRGTVRRSSASMFDGVAQLAAATGASLSSNRPMPSPDPGLPMMAGHAELARLAAPILADFLAATADVAPAPADSDFPTLPAAMAGHGLYEPMGAALLRIAALSASPAKWKPARVTDALAVLNLLHCDVFEAVARCIRAAGHTLADKRIRLAAANLAEKVERITVTGDKWEYDKNGLPEPDNSDNVVTLLGVLGLDLRWNAWTERMEIQGGIDSDTRWPIWTYVDDTVVAKLRTRANRTKTRFRPGRDFLWETLLSLAHANAVDPILDALATAAAEWDGVARLDGWLARYVGTPSDTYHQAVGRLIIGGMVRRARHPGCKFDFMPIFFGRQGTGKSTMAAILADMGLSSLRDIGLGNGRHFTDNVMLGDASKELILALSGKLVAEIGEMGTRGNANVTHIKAMLSRQVDEGRTAYARAVTERPRRNIMIGTTNDSNPLTDTTGNRRFLPISVQADIDLAGLHADIRQLIGEAAALETSGETFDLPRDVWAIAGEHQEDARAVGDIEARLCAWFAETSFTAAAFVSTEELAELCDLAGWRNVHTLRNSIMERLGFQAVQPYIHGIRTRGWQRGAGKAEAITRYTIGRTQDGRPRVGIRAAGVAGGPGQVGRVLPPLPY